MSDDFETTLRQERLNGAVFQSKGPTLAGLGDRLENPPFPVVAILSSQHRRVNVVKGHAAAGHFARSDRPVYWLRHMYSGCVLRRCHPSCGRAPFHRGCVRGWADAWMSALRKPSSSPSNTASLLTNQSPVYARWLTFHCAGKRASRGCRRRLHSRRGRDRPNAFTTGTRLSRPGHLTQRSENRTRYFPSRPASTPDPAGVA